MNFILKRKETAANQRKKRENTHTQSVLCCAVLCININGIGKPIQTWASVVFSVGVESAHIFLFRSAILFIDVQVLRRFAWIGWHHHQDYQLLIQVFIYQKKRAKKKKRKGNWKRNPTQCFHLRMYSDQHLIAFRENIPNKMESNAKIPRQERNDRKKVKNNNITITKHRCCEKFISRPPHTIFLHHTTK